MSPTAAFEFEDVTKDYPAGLLGRRRLRAVEGVSFRVDPGEVVGLLGPNRAGKTTLVKILLTLCRPTSGASPASADPPPTAGPWRLGYVHERPGLPSPPVGRRPAGVLRSPVVDPFRRGPPPDSWPARSGRAGRPRPRADRPVQQGNDPAAGVAQALINEPDLLVLDEPGEGLDLAGRALVGDVIVSHRRRGRSVLLVSHALADAERYCDRIAVLVGGRLAHWAPLGSDGAGRRPRVATSGSRSTEPVRGVRI